MVRIGSSDIGRIVERIPNRRAASATMAVSVRPARNASVRSTCSARSRSPSWNQVSPPSSARAGRNSSSRRLGPILVPCRRARRAYRGPCRCRAKSRAPNARNRRAVLTMTDSSLPGPALAQRRAWRRRRRRTARRRDPRDRGARIGHRNKSRSRSRASAAAGRARRASKRSPRASTAGRASAACPISSEAAEASSSATAISRHPAVHGRTGPARLFDRPARAGRSAERHSDNSIAPGAPETVVDDDADRNVERCVEPDASARAARPSGSARQEQNALVPRSGSTFD